MHVFTTRFWASPTICALFTLIWVFVAPLDTLQAASDTKTAGEAAATARQGTRHFDNGSVQNRLSLEAGYRRDELDWSIAGKLFDYTQHEDVTVNVLSELTWRDLDILQVGLKNESLFADHYFLRFSFSHGTIFNGENQDSDYKEPNRTGEWSRSNNSADDGDVSDMSVAAGYRFAIWKKQISLIPMLGYSYHEQNLVMTDGYQTVSEPDAALHLNPPEVGAFDNLNSTYEARWRGPWLGVDAEYTLVLPRPALTMSFGLGLEYHWADYSASADWNLRSDLAHPESFEHEAGGTGYVVAARWRCQFANHVGVRLSFNYQDWSTKAGTDRVYLSTGEVDETRLNEVNWTSRSALLGIDYTF
jgi:hypothetical protein